MLPDCSELVLLVQIFFIFSFLKDSFKGILIEVVLEDARVVDAVKRPTDPESWANLVTFEVSKAFVSVSPHAHLTSLAVRVSPPCAPTSAHKLRHLMGMTKKTSKAHEVRASSQRRKALSSAPLELSAGVLACICGCEPARKRVAVGRRAAPPLETPEGRAS